MNCGLTLLATCRHKKEMKIDVSDSARSCAGVQLNAPTPLSAGSDEFVWLVDVGRQTKDDTGLVTDKR